MNGGMPHPLATLRAGWKIILACVVVIAIIAAGYVHTRTKTYGSAIELQLVASDPTQTSDTAGRVLLDVKNYATGDVVIDDAAKTLGYPADVVRAHINVAVQADSDAILLQGEAPTAAEAELVAKTVAGSMVKLVGQARAAYYANLAISLNQQSVQALDNAADPKTSPAQRAIASQLATSLTQSAAADVALATSSNASLTLATADPTPGAPEGTPASTSMAIAVILGLLLGAAIVLGRAGLRRTVDPNELVAGGAVEGVPVLGVLGRKGKQEITADVLLDVLVAARAAEPNHETLVVAGLTRDVSTRDFARALADLSAKGQATVLVDADLGSDGRPAAGPTDGVSKRPQLADLLRRARAAAGRDERFQRADATVPAGTAPLVVPAGEAYGETTALLPYVPRVLDRMRQQAEVVIAIAPPLNTAAGRSVAASADVVVVITSEKRTLRADLHVLAGGPVPAATQVIGLVAIADTWVRPPTPPARPVRADATVPQPAATTAATPPAGANAGATAAPAPAPTQSRPQPAPARTVAPPPTSAPRPAPVPASAPRPAADPRPTSEPWPTAADFRAPAQAAPPAAATPRAVPAAAPSASAADGIDPWPEARVTPFGDGWPKVDLNTPVERDARWDVDSEWGTGWTTQDAGNSQPNGTGSNGTGSNGTVTNGATPQASTPAGGNTTGGSHRTPSTELPDTRHPRPPWNRFTRDR